MVKAVRSLVAGSTEALELLEDDAPVLARPVPSVLEEGFARQVMLLDALSSQTADDLRFGSDRGRGRYQVPSRR